MKRLLIVSAICLSCLGSAGAAEDQKPKFGPDAIPITVDNAYLRTHDAPDYWAFSPFIKPQFTSSACSVASVTGALNGLAGLPALAEETVMSQPELLEIVGDGEWVNLSDEEGDGVTFAQLQQFTREALDKTDKQSYALESWKPASNDAATLENMRSILAENEKSSSDAILVYFNQGVLTGDWDGPHVSVVGAYDAETHRILMLDVDQEWYVSYWSPDEKLLEAMLKPAPADQGVLAGETGGFVHVTRQ